MKAINLSDVIIFHKKIIQATGGSDGIRDIGLIESSLNRAFASFDGQDLYKGIEDKISAITWGLIKTMVLLMGIKE